MSTTPSNPNGDEAQQPKYPDFERLLNEAMPAPDPGKDHPKEGHVLSDAEWKAYQQYLRFRDELTEDEHRGHIYAEKIRAYIDKHKGTYLRDENGGYHVLIGNKRVPLEDNRENHALVDLILKSCNATIGSSSIRSAIQRITNDAWYSSSRLMFRQFSAMSKDEKNRPTIYMPLSTGKLLCVTVSGCRLVHNGDNEANLWLEHPAGDPMNVNGFDDAEKVSTALADFEGLLVETQACAVPEMRWFVAMHEALFPYIRDAHPARMIVVHRGGSQSGKTTGAQRFTLLQGLNEVKADYSPAALRNMLDIGLLVLDNREQTNFTQALIDYCLFLATGGEHGRSNQDGTLRTHGTYRPVGVITTIEGVPKTELQRRCVNVDYQVPEGTERLRREPIESEITRLRHEVLSALVFVLGEYLALRQEYIDTPNPIPEFEEHFTSLCYLLRAYGWVARKPQDWAEKIISVWAKTLAGTAAAKDGDDLEDTILYVLSSGMYTTGGVQKDFEHKGVKGTLYITESAQLLAELRRANPKMDFPNAQGLSQRLKTTRLLRCEFLNTDSVPPLKRTSTRRPIGFFVRNEEAERQGS